MYPFSTVELVIIIGNPMCIPSPIQKNLYLGIYGWIQQKHDILVVRKSRGPYKGLLDLPGSKPHHGEPLLQALTREIQEETGIIATTYSLLGNFSFVTTYIDTDGFQKELYHIALIYQVTDCNSKTFNSSIIAKDVNGSLWIHNQKLDKKNSSPLVQAIIENNKLFFHKTRA